MKLIAAVFGSGGLVAGFNYMRAKVNARKSSEQLAIESFKESTNIAVDALKNQLKDITDRVRSLEQQNEKLKQEIHTKNETIIELRSQLSRLHAHYDNLPFPVWAKGIDGTVIYLNTAYERVFLYPLDLRIKDLIGTKAEAAYGKDAVDTMQQNDFSSYRSEKRNWIGVEMVPLTPPEPWIIKKWTEELNGSVLAYYGAAFLTTEHAQMIIDNHNKTTS